MLFPLHRCFARQYRAYQYTGRRLGVSNHALQNWQAESFFQLVLHVREQTLGFQHCDTAETMYGIAQLRGAQGTTKKPEACMPVH